MCFVLFTWRRVSWRVTELLDHQFLSPSAVVCSWIFPRLSVVWAHNSTIFMVHVAPLRDPVFPANFSLHHLPGEPREVVGRPALRDRETTLQQDTTATTRYSGRSNPEDVQGRNSQIVHPSFCLQMAIIGHLIYYEGCHVRCSRSFIAKLQNFA